MPESSHIAKLAMLPLRVVQGIFAIIVLALAAYGESSRKEKDERKK